MENSENSDATSGLFTRIWRWKAATLSWLLLLIPSVGCFVWANMTDNNVFALILQSLGSALLSGFLVIIVFEVLLRDESATRLGELVGEKIREMRSEIDGAIVRSVALDGGNFPDGLSENAVDVVIKKALEARFSDSDLAQEGYDALRRQLLDHSVKLSSLDVDCELIEITSSQENFPFKDLNSQDYFLIKMRWRARRLLLGNTFVFKMAPTQEDFNSIISSKSADYVFRFPPSIEQQLLKLGVGFDCEYLKVDGQSIDLNVLGDESGYECMLPPTNDTCRERQVEYRIWAVTRRDAHVLTFEVSKPTRSANWRVGFDVNIVDSVRVLDFLASAERPNVEFSPDERTPRSVRFSVDGWILPKSGVSLVWSLKSENSNRQGACINAISRRIAGKR